MLFEKNYMVIVRYNFRKHLAFFVMCLFAGYGLLALLTRLFAPDLNAETGTKAFAILVFGSTLYFFFVPGKIMKENGLDRVCPDCFHAITKGGVCPICNVLWEPKIEPPEGSPSDEADELIRSTGCQPPVG